MTDEKILKIVYVLLCVFSLKYFIYIFEVPYRFLFTDYRSQSTFASEVKLLKENAGDLKKEQYVGFVSEAPQNKVFDYTGPIKNFYIAQFAIVPAVLKNDTARRYIIGMFDANTVLEPGIKIKKRLNNKIYILERGVR